MRTKREIEETLTRNALAIKKVREAAEAQRDVQRQAETTNPPIQEAPLPRSR